MLSVVIPPSRDMSLGWLPRSLAVLVAHPGIQVIVVDNNSGDGTDECVRAAGCTWINLPSSSRAERLNAGVAAAVHPRVLFHHPRSRLAPDGIEALLRLPDSVAWGGFTHRFDRSHPLLEWTSFYSNRIRMDRRGIVYLDHCIFFRRDLLPADPVPPRFIFEDTALSLRLRRFGRPLRLPQPAVTSAVRYEHNGLWRQATMNQVMKVGYAARLPDPWLNRIYERGLNLNGKTRR